MSTGSRLSSGGHSDFVPPPPGVLTGIGPGKGRRRPPQDLATPRYLGRAAQYVRMSTEHQRYSTENQADAIRQYAERRGLEVIRTYADKGKSGLSLDGRDALQRLIRDVENGAADFSTILVYDVTRWGRFQDADESAYYEYICRRAGIEVQYCAEQFENDGSPVSTIVKGVKRAMAGEYSRELSAKVFAGQCRLIEIGYRQGGPAGYGLRRMLVDQTGAHTLGARLGIIMQSPKEEGKTPAGAAGGENGGKQRSCHHWRRSSGTRGRCVPSKSGAGFHNSRKESPSGIFLAPALRTLAFAYRQAALRPALYSLPGSLSSLCSKKSYD